MTSNTFLPSDLAFISLCPEGLDSARRLEKAFPGASLYIHQKFAAPGIEDFERVADLSALLWKEKRGLVYFAPTGAIVRSIAPLVESKYTDPAVVVCDVHARWAIALLSGHEGGANDLTLAVANRLGAEPVITTTTETLKTLVVGVGCRRGESEIRIQAAILEALKRCNARTDQVRYLASAELKKDEAGLLETAKNLGIPLRFIAEKEISASQRSFSSSEVAERNLNLPGVAEPAALLAGRRTRLLLPRTVIEGCTVAVAIEEIQ